MSQDFVWLAGGNMWISKEESGIVTSTLKPKMDKTRKAHESLLDEAITLQVSLHLAKRQSMA